MAPAAPRLDDLVEELRARGWRATAARRAVLAALLKAGDRHLTADELAHLVARRHPTVHLSTVYRTLDALTEAGVIAPARVADRPVTFHLARDEHHHAICSTCGSTVSLPVDVLESLHRRLLDDYGFSAHPRHLTIPGVCRACATRH